MTLVKKSIRVQKGTNYEWREKPRKRGKKATNSNVLKMTYLQFYFVFYII